MHGLSTVHSPLAVVAWHKRCLITIEPATARARPRPNPVAAPALVPVRLVRHDTPRRSVAVAAHKFEYNTKNNINIARQQRQQQGDKINECKRKQRVTNTHTHTHRAKHTHTHTDTLCVLSETDSETRRGKTTKNEIQINLKIDLATAATPAAATTTTATTTTLSTATLFRDRRQHKKLTQNQNTCIKKSIAKITFALAKNNKQSKQRCMGRLVDTHYSSSYEENHKFKLN